MYQPSPLGGQPRNALNRQKKKDAAIRTAALNPADTLTQRAAIDVGEIDAHIPNDSHSKEFGEELTKHLSGKGLRFDHIAAGNHVIQALRGGGLHKRDLLHAYIHGRVPHRRKMFSHPVQRNPHHNADVHIGGSLPGILHSISGIRVAADQVPPSHALIL